MPKKRNGSMKEQMEGLEIAIKPRPDNRRKKTSSSKAVDAITKYGSKKVAEMNEKKKQKGGEVTDKKIIKLFRKYAITPHLMDVDFFNEPSFDKWIDAARAANKAGAPIPYVSPIARDSIEALKVGFNSFLEEFKERREKKQEGGDIDNQMNALMPVEETSADKEDRDIEAQMEELEAAKTSLPAEEDIIPDEQMEDKYLDFVISQSLSPEEETALMNKLEADPELSVMFDKIMDTAIEFSGSGPVEGPGSEVSDSIPARLSDGEFVFTSKAADQIGEERLQSMMEDAEAESDDVERQEIALGGAIEDKNTITKEIKNSMLSINPRLR
jgi:hypothetical protein